MVLVRTIASFRGGNIPEWFRIGFDPRLKIGGAPQLRLAFAKEPLERFFELLPRRYVAEHRNLLAYARVQSDFLFAADKWGFGGVIQKSENVIQKSENRTEDGMVHYAIALPRVEGFTISDNVPVRGRVLSQTHQVLATLNLLSHFFQSYKTAWGIGSGVRRHQLLLLHSYYGFGSGSQAVIRGSLSPAFYTALKTLSPIQFSSVRQAIVSTLLQQCPSWIAQADQRFGASILGEDLLMWAPAGATLSSTEGADGGRDLYSTRVGRAELFLALYCGLAALCGEAERVLYPTQA